MMMMNVDFRMLSQFQGHCLFILCGYARASYGGRGNIIRGAIPLLTIEKTVDEMHHYEQGEFHLGMF
jgi:hypothetical protein